MISVQQKKWTSQNGWQDVGRTVPLENPSLVLVFGGSSIVSKDETYEQIRKMYPNATIILSSSAGEIIGTEVADDTIVLAAIAFQETKIICHKTSITNTSESKRVGKELGATLPQENLQHVMVFSDGLKVNGTELVLGLAESLPQQTAVTGGLVGDGVNFKHTFVGLNESAKEGQIVLVGFYGDKLQVGYGSVGGWDTFGLERIITKAKGNVLYELDGESALSLYQKYLGDKAKELPSSALLFPLALRIKLKDGNEVEIVRTVLAVDEKEQSMTFAGDMPEGIPAKLMKANFDHLVEGASNAAGMSLVSIKDKPEFAILVSCIGRKLVLKERVEEELEAVRQIIGPQASMIGFYSYGEICPTAPTEKQCQLHNQTMTITTFKEI